MQSTAWREFKAEREHGPHWTRRHEDIHILVTGKHGDGEPLVFLLANLNDCAWTARFLERKPKTPNARALEAEFTELVNRWHLAVRFSSSIKKRLFHPAYQRIIGLGPSAIPLLLRELRDRPNHWFWALASITGEDPAVNTETFEDARKAWLEWGVERGFLPA